MTANSAQSRGAAVTRLKRTTRRSVGVFAAMRALTLVLLATTVEMPSARASTPVATAQVRVWLSGFDSQPSAEFWRQQPPETLATLQTLYNTPGEALIVRLRALAAAAYFPGPVSRRFLLKVARDTGAKELLRRQAVLALGRSLPGRELTILLPFVNDAQPRVREAAVRGARRLDSAAVRNVLAKRRSVERDYGVRQALQ